MQLRAKWSFRFCGAQVLAVILLAFSASAVSVPPLDSKNEEEILRQAFETNPEQFTTEMQRILRRGDVQTAARMAESILDKNPKNAIARAVYGMGFAAEGDAEAAGRQLDLLPAPRESAVETLCLEAMVLRLEGKLPQALETCALAIAKDSGHPYCWNVKGRIELEKGDLERARESFSEALKLEQDFTAGRLNLAAVLFMLDKQDDAAKQFGIVLGKAPRSHQAHFGLGVIEAQRGQVDKALDHVTRALDADPRNPAYLDKLARLQLDAGNYPEALETAERLQTAGGDQAPLLMASALLRIGDAPKALGIVSEISTSTPETDYLRGLCHLAQNDFKPAAAAMDEVLKKDGSHFGALAAKAALAMQEGTPVAWQTISKKAVLSKAQQNLISFFNGVQEAAAGHWQAAFPLLRSTEGMVQGFSMDGLDEETLRGNMTPEEAPALVLGVFFYSNSILPAATGAFERSLSRNPRSIFANYFKAQALLGQKRRPEALTHFKAALDVAPGFFTALYAAAEIELMLHGPEAALPLYQRALSVKKDAGILLKAGLIYEQKQMFGEAEKAYKELIALAPDFFVGYNQLAWLYAKQGIQQDAALELARKADTLNPGNASVLDTMGWVQHQMGNTREAIANLEKADSITPQRPTILYHLGVVYHADGRNEEARKALAAAFQTNERFEFAEAARKLLNSIP